MRRLFQDGNYSAPPGTNPGRALDSIASRTLLVSAINGFAKRTA